MREGSWISGVAQEIVWMFGGAKDLKHNKDPLELELMRSVKQVLDPRGRMNPGKVL